MSDRMKIGDAVEVHFLETEGIGNGYRPVDIWKPATVCVAEDESGAIGAAYADGSREMVQRRRWTKPYKSHG